MKKLEIYQMENLEGLSGGFYTGMACAFTLAVGAGLVAGTGGVGAGIALNIGAAACGSFIGMGSGGDWW